jgi:2-C-methyl-D-erythritol 2,4-cyclodiphosphate synthase
VSDVHVLAACAASPSTSAGEILASAGITAQRLLALDDSTAEPPPPDIGMDGAADFLARAESWIAEERAGTTLGMSLLPEEGVGPSAPARSARHVTHVGTGYDSHRFVSGGPLTLGGVVIPFEMSLAGHSDGDAVAHAITDAILGAAGAGDIGEMFPDSDPANRGRDSIEMLRAAVARVRDAGWSVQQVDVTVIAERPKLAPHRAAMCGRLAIALECAPGCVNVKGKTNEGMGWIGRGEGLACIAVATLTSARAL